MVNFKFLYKSPTLEKRKSSSNQNLHDFGFKRREFFRVCVWVTKKKSPAKSRKSPGASNVPWSLHGCCHRSRGARMTLWWFQTYFGYLFVKLLGGVITGKNFIFLICSTLPGEMIQFDEHIFQLGWFNHQLDERWRDSSLVGCFSSSSFMQRSLNYPVLGRSNKWIGLRNNPLHKGISGSKPPTYHQLIHVSF